MTREPVALIGLQCAIREDGTMHVSSPDIPLFHVVGKDMAEVEQLALAVLEEHFLRNHQIRLTVRPAESLEDFLTRRKAPRTVPAHVIAEMAA